MHIPHKSTNMAHDLKRTITANYQESIVIHDTLKSVFIQFANLLVHKHTKKREKAETTTMGKYTTYIVIFVLPPDISVRYHGCCT